MDGIVWCGLATPPFALTSISIPITSAGAGDFILTKKV